MTVDNCSKMPNMVFSSESCGNKYYVNQDTNEVHCACGVEADFPHRCEAEPEKKTKSDDEKELHSYLGDGVYAFFDGYSIRLRTGDHRDNEFDQEIFLEPEVLYSLNKFYERVKQSKKESVKDATKDN